MLAKPRRRLAVIIGGGLFVVCILCVVVANLGTGKPTPTPPATGESVGLKASSTPPPTASPTLGPSPTGMPAPTVVPSPIPPTPNPCPYIGNSNTRKFHRASCGEIRKMNEENKVCLATREDAIAQGYVPCGKCNP